MEDIYVQSTFHFWMDIFNLKYLPTNLLTHICWHLDKKEMVHDNSEFQFFFFQDALDIDIRSEWDKKWSMILIVLNWQWLSIIYEHG